MGKCAIFCAQSTKSVQITYVFTALKLCSIHQTVLYTNIQRSVITMDIAWLTL